MAEPMTATAHGSHGGDEVTKRDFLKLVAGAGAAVGAGAMAWPLIDSMNPSKDVLALSSIDVELKSIQPGQAITTMWRGKPVFVRHRTAEEIKAARAEVKGLADPATDQDRVKPGKDEWLVVVGICTHLGCVPVGNKPTDQRGEYGGWFCPCHGSQYDTSGRVRHGPAPANLPIPPYAFLTDTKIKIG
ncbi:MAG: ubiquinol-cytochrome c reductase iron-sulfur subunit [Alphaproteobacteria bacterium]|nr:ubiquinol-cytochrome c reductase iron-sulfur subunit [Alphaproteobacteria bacterium]